MSNTIGFITLNAYALIILIFLEILFHSKARQHHVEDNTYSKLLTVTLVTTIAGLILGLLVSSPESNILIVKVVNKLYLYLIDLWITILTFYTYYISKVKNEQISNKTNVFLLTISIINFILIIILPIDVTISNKGTISSGLSIYYSYLYLGVCFILQVILIVLDYKHINSKKYIPVYLFIFFGILSYVIQLLFPKLNYLINPSLVLIVLFMYHTIENPDLKIINELEYARDRADKANRAKSDFLSSMSHEIRTPLNAIVGFSEDISDNLEGTNDNIREDAEYIQEASRTLLEIVGNILDINKIESGKMELVEAKYNFREEIIPLAKMDAKRIEDKPIEFKVNISEDVPGELIGDSGKIKEIVNNLLTNAIKYTDSGMVSLNVKCINEDDICKLIISVEDTGHGIKKENIEKLFTKFERLDVERNTTVEGTGLGLAITKELVEMMGGKINVQSTFGKGSVFIAIIPQKISKESKMTTIVFNKASDNPSKESTKATNNTSDGCNSKRVLIVDDNNLNVRVAERDIAELNFNIDVATNGKEAIDKINQNKYDLILMDIMMPEMSGETCLRELKKNPSFNTPVIALTADAVAGAEQKYINEGFVDYLAKPFKKEDIVKKIKKNLPNKDEVI